MNSIDRKPDGRVKATLEAKLKAKLKAMSIRRIAASLAVMTLAVTLVSGCGFHLRGKVALSKDLTPLAISGNDDGLVAVLKEALEFSGTPVVDSAASAQAVLRLTKSRVRRQVRTTDSRGLATAYRLHYRVRYDVLNRAGEVIVKGSRLSQSRDLDFDASQILTKEDEQRFLIEDMQREIAQNILRTLSVLATLDAVSQRASRLATAGSLSPDAG